MERVMVRFCPEGVPTFDEYRWFRRIPQRGESIIRGESLGRFVVVDLEWNERGEPFVVAHSITRPRARRALGLE